MVKIQSTIWNYIIDTWKLCNAHLHQAAAQMDLPNYQQVVINLLPLDTQYTLYHQPLETILKHPTS